MQATSSFFVWTLVLGPVRMIVDSGLAVDAAVVGVERSVSLQATNMTAMAITATKPDTLRIEVFTIALSSRSSR
jgi:hypothetical protein